jgi:hypothetical protein
MSAPLIPPIFSILGQASPLVGPSSLTKRSPSTQRPPTTRWYPTTRIGILRCQTTRVAPLTMDMLDLLPSIHTASIPLRMLAMKPRAMVRIGTETPRVCLEIWLGIWDTASALGEPAFPMVALLHKSCI